MTTKAVEARPRGKTMALTDACRRLRCGYAVAYDYYLRNRLKGWKRKSRIVVTVKSVDALRIELGLTD